MKIGQVYERMSEANMPLREFRRGHAEGKSAYKKAVDDGASSSFIAGIQKGEYTERGIGYFLPKKGAPITPELKGRLCGYAMGRKRHWIFFAKKGCTDNT
ncbi:MAG: hypothetical protein HYT73_02115 [Candidatus Aenigmarchaeota archaeon]|nr:hypothetical protein [Candidatus Aenigmarchaeota archaeon]